MLIFDEKAENKDGSLSTIESYIKKHKNHLLFVFTATWCGPCAGIKERIKTTIVDDLSYDSKVTVFNVDVDQNPETAIAYKIRGVPTLMLFESGNTTPIKVGNGIAGLDEILKIIQ